MQRNSSNLQFISFAFFTFWLIIYQIITSLHQFLPPLIGVFFVNLIVLNYEHDTKFKDLDYRWYFSIFYMVLAEQIHGFRLFSSVAVFFIFYFFIFEWLLKTVKFRNFSIVLYVVMAYVGTFLMSNFISYISQSEYMQFGHEYILYLIIESIIAIFLYRGRIL